MAKYYHPDEFAALADEGRAMGFAHVESGPLVRSSYHAKKQTEGAETAAPRPRAADSVGTMVAGAEPRAARPGHPRSEPASRLSLP